LPAHERGTFAILDVAKTQFRAVTKHSVQFGETGNKRRELMALWLKFKNEPLTEQSSQKRCDEYVDDVGRQMQLFEKAGLLPSVRTMHDVHAFFSQLRDDNPS
jgi:hypothetical protein